MAKAILIIGAGELGIAVLEALMKHPERSNARISVLLRQATIDSEARDKRKTVDYIRNLGANFEAADVVASPTSNLESIFSRYDTVIGCSGLGLPPGTQKRLTEAVLGAKVPRYFPWQWGVDYDAIGKGSTQDLFDEQLEIRAMLRAQSYTNWIIISTGLFMSFLFLPAFGVVDFERQKVRALGGWENRVTLTTSDDIGHMAAEIVFRPKQIERRVVFIAGDTVSYGQVADLMDEHFKIKFEREEWNIGILGKLLEEKPDDMMRKYQGVFGAGRGVAWNKEETVNANRCINMTTLKTYLEKMYPQDS